MWSNLHDCPCTRDCPDRVPGCHGTCPKYKEWRAMVDDAKKAATVRKESRCLTHAAVKAYRKHCLRDRSGAYKKFSQ